DGIRDFHVTGVQTCALPISKYFNKLIQVNTEEGWAIVQPGIVRDDLNHHLKQYGYFFAPETSTANRAMIGGMIGNNSCGSNSVRSEERRVGKECRSRWSRRR